MISFLGLATYLESFIPNFADLVDPLRKILRKRQNLEWGDQQNCTFKLMKKSLEDAKKITYWKQFRKTRLTVDASLFYIRGNTRAKTRTP